MVTSPNLQRGRGVDHVAGEDHLHRAAFADQARQALRAAAAAHDAEIDLGLGKSRVLARHADVARQRELVAAAETEAVDHRDHGFWKCVDRIEKRTLVKKVALRDGRLRRRIR